MVEVCPVKRGNTNTGPLMGYFEELLSRVAQPPSSALCGRTAARVKRHIARRMAWTSATVLLHTASNHPLDFAAARGLAPCSPGFVMTLFSRRHQLQPDSGPRAPPNRAKHFLQHLCYLPCPRSCPSIVLGGRRSNRVRHVSNSECSCALWTGPRCSFGWHNRNLVCT